MFVQSSSGKYYFDIAKVKLVDEEHPSRSSIHSHIFDGDGSLKPSSYLFGICSQMKKMTENLNDFSGLQLHLLKFQSPITENKSSIFSKIFNSKTPKRIAKKYFKFLLIVTSKSSNSNQMSDFEINSSVRLTPFQEKEIQILKNYIEITSDGKLSIRSNAFSANYYNKYGFELSRIEENYLITEIAKLQRNIPNHNMTNLDETQFDNSKSQHSVIGYTDQQIPIQNAGFPVIIIGDPTPIKAITNQGIILTDKPEIYENISTINHKVDKDISVGINVFQFYSSYPGVLIDIINGMKEITNDKKLSNSFFELIDEIYSTVEPEIFVGMSIENVIISDENRLYKTISNQQTRYYLHSIFSQYFNHPFFNIHQPYPLQESGIHLLDVSLLNKNQKIMVELLFRVLHSHEFIRGPIISDLVSEAVLTKTNPKLQKLNYISLPSQYITILPYFSPEIVRTELAEMIIVPASIINESNYSTFQRQELGIDRLIPFQGKSDHVLIFPNQKATIIDYFDHKVVEDKIELLSDLEFTYSSINIDEDYDFQEIIDEEPDIYIEEYLSQYHIISILSIIPDYQTFNVDDVELKLQSEIILDKLIDQMIEKTYLKGKVDEFEVDTRGRNYLHTIKKSYNEVIQVAEFEIESGTLLEQISNKIVSFLAEIDPSKKYSILMILLPLIEELQDKLENEVLNNHFLGIFASMKYIIETGEENEQIDEYLRQVNLILEGLTENEDLTTRVILKLEEDEEKDNQQSLDEVILETKSEIDIENSGKQEKMINEGNLTQLKEITDYESNESEVIDNHQEIHAKDTEIQSFEWMDEFTNSSNVDDIEKEPETKTEELQTMSKELITAAVNKVVQSEEIQSIINKVASSETIDEREEDFSPKHNEGIGPWYPTTGFIHILEIETKKVNEKPNSIVAFLLQYMRFKNINSTIQLDLILKYFDWVDLRKDFMSWPLIQIENENIIFNTDRLDELPKLPKSRQRIIKTDILPFATKMLNSLIDKTSEIKSQRNKQQLITIFDYLDIPEFSFILHALLIDQNKKLHQLLQKVLMTIVDPKIENFPHLAKGLLKNNKFRQLHGFDNMNPKKLTNRGNNDNKIQQKQIGKAELKKNRILSNLPKPKIIEKKTDVANYLNLNKPKGNEGSNQEISQKNQSGKKQTDVPTLPSGRQTIETIPIPQLDDIFAKERVELVDKIKNSINPSGDLNSSDIYSIVSNLTTLIQEGPSVLLRKVTEELFATFNISFPDLSTNDLIRLLGKIQREYDVSITGLILNFADIQVNWDGKSDHDKIILIEYYLNRVVKTLNNFTWNSKINKRTIMSLLD